MRDWLIQLCVEPDSQLLYRSCLNMQPDWIIVGEEVSDRLIYPQDPLSVLWSRLRYCAESD